MKGHFKKISSIFFILLLSVGLTTIGCDDYEGEGDFYDPYETTDGGNPSGGGGC